MVGNIYRKWTCITMTFSENIANLRKKAGLSQQALASKAEVSLAQLKHSESGKSQPTLEVIARLAVSLDSSADDIVFDINDRLPANQRLRTQFGAIAKLKISEQEVIASLLDAYIKKNQMEELLKK